MSIVGTIIERLKEKDINPDKIFLAVSYFKKYGYLKENFSLEDFVSAIQKFHTFLHPSKSDKEELNEDSFNIMLRPRCGIADIFPISLDSKWRSNKLKYTVVSYVNGLAKSIQDSNIEQAYNLVSSISNISFTRTNSLSDANIIIGTGQGRNDGFDGPSGILAWCEIPNQQTVKVNLKFDIDETWINNPSQRGILHLNVFAHESLHGIGILHTNVPHQLMNPFYDINISTPQDNDIKEIRALYGLPPVTPPPPPPPPPPTTPGTMTINITGDFEVNIPGYRLLKTT